MDERTDERTENTENTENDERRTIRAGGTR